MGAVNSINKIKKSPKSLRMPPSNIKLDDMPMTHLVGVFGRDAADILELEYEMDVKVKFAKSAIDGYMLIKVYGHEDVMAKAKEWVQNLIDDIETRQTLDPKPWMDALKHRNQLLRYRDDRQNPWARLSTMKNFYWEDPDVKEMPKGEADLFRATNNVVVRTVFGRGDARCILNPVVTFKQAFRFFRDILEGLEFAGFTAPSPIQAQAWPMLLRGLDLVAIAPSGAGKKLAYLLPALVHVKGQRTKRKDRSGPAAIVMAATDEVASQIEHQAGMFQYKEVTAARICGELGRKQTQADVVIATPGQFADSTEEGHLDLHHVTYVVLDDVERMLDLGFDSQIRKLMSKVMLDRQTVMTFSTWPSSLRRLAKTYMDDAVQVCVGSVEPSKAHAVQHVIEVLDGDGTCEKDKALCAFLEKVDYFEQVIVFCSMKCRALNVSSDLSSAGFRCQALLGDEGDKTREQLVDNVVVGSTGVLVVTDLASRQLDVDCVKYVVNYDFPPNMEEYVSRVGRAGRAARRGTCVSFLTSENGAQAAELIAILEEAEQCVPKALRDMADKFGASKKC